MAKSISIREYPYVLEADKSLPIEQQTIFYIVPRTVRQTTESAALYAKALRESRRGGSRKTEVDQKAMNNASEAEWLGAVKRISNFIVTGDAPEKAYDHFSIKSTEDPSVYKKIEGREEIVVVSTEDPIDLRYIYYAMDPVQIEEVVNASQDYSQLTAAEKNV